VSVDVLTERSGAEGSEHWDPEEYVAPTARARRFTMSRRVHLGEIDGEARLRMEPLVRFLQDIATEDADDSGLREMGGLWVVRRLVFRIDELPLFHDRVDLLTFCSGTGPRWAERRTTVSVEGRARVESAALWVFVDDDQRRPVLLREPFFSLYGVSPDERKVSSRLRHHGVPEHLRGRPWPLRESDFDVLAHVNNARYWEAVEDEMAAKLPGRVVGRAEMEFRGAIRRDAAVDILSEVHDVENDAELWVWLRADGELCMSARLGTVDPDRAGSSRSGRYRV
jgi:acyl-ACP thioesterase